MRFQFYPTEELQQRIEFEANRKGISVSSEIIEKLEIAYDIADSGTLDMLPFSELLSRVQKEIEKYIDDYTKNPEEHSSDFTLIEISKTLQDLSFTDSKKRPNALKGRIGLNIRKNVDRGVVIGITPLLGINGETKKRNGAALYTVI